MSDDRSSSLHGRSLWVLHGAWTLHGAWLYITGGIRLGDVTDRCMLQLGDGCSDYNSCRLKHLLVNVVFVA